MNTLHSSLPWWARLLATFLVVSQLSQALSEKVPKDRQLWREAIHYPWLETLLGPIKRDLGPSQVFWASGANKQVDPAFWAIRGKRDSNPNTNSVLLPIPSIKMSMKPNGLYGASAKRAYLKPNSLFSAFKRSAKLSSPRLSKIEEIKRKLKELFSSYSRTGLKQNAAYMKTMSKPASVYSTYRRSMKPNGLFGVAKKSEVNRAGNDNNIIDDLIYEPVDVTPEFLSEDDNTEDMDYEGDASRENYERNKAMLEKLTENLLIT